MTHNRVAAGIAGGTLSVIATLTSLPLLAVGSGDRPVGCAQPVESADDGTPSILGPSTLTVADLTAWWTSADRGQPARLNLPIEDVIALYITEGGAEGVRGDIAFAQAVHETGYFTNRDTAINNFAGIGHPDHAVSGRTFPDALTGVRAQIQLLKKYALGNDVALGRPDVAPDAGASATTWGGLAGTWASSTRYWTSIDAVYQSMSEQAGSGDALPPWPPAPRACRLEPLAVSGRYALPVDPIWYDEHPEWFNKTHHDYPAADIPVPTGTPLYTVTSGAVVSTPTSGRCGIGVVLNGDDGAQYTYCHGLAGSHAVATGDRVSAGQVVMSSASTGNSTGPHLHFGIRVDGQNRCPQTFLVAIADGRALDPLTLPSAGCTH
jgi:murein DD-endopeptidase MepM/ murein hydrolase activator NlpD